MPVDDKIKNIVYATESIENELKIIIKKHKDIVQAYYNDKNSYTRIYPYFDVIGQLEAKMNIPEFYFYLSLFQYLLSKILFQIYHPQN